MNALGRVLIIAGVILIISGLVIVSGIKIPYIGRLPGDIYVKKPNFAFYFPLTTCIILSILLSLILWLLRKR